MDRFYQQFVTLVLLAVFTTTCTLTSTRVPEPSATITMQQLPSRTAANTPDTTLQYIETVPGGTDRMRIKLILENSELTATLDNNQTARDFVSLLPLNLTLEDYAGTEKISNLPQTLSTEDAPAGSDPAIGDITYYAPWGNLAIFYKDFGYASGLVILGKIDNGMEALSGPGSVEVTIELVD